jgi:hypothetical protein
MLDKGGFHGNVVICGYLNAGELVPSQLELRWPSWRQSRGPVFPSGPPGLHPRSGLPAVAPFGFAAWRRIQRRQVIWICCSSGSHGSPTVTRLIR